MNPLGGGSLSSTASTPSEAGGAPLELLALGDAVALEDALAEALADGLPELVDVSVVV